MIRLRLDIAYDGTEFSGWAVQPGLRTVQGEIEVALAMLLRVPVEKTRLTVGGRTDAGVHARGQVAHLDVTAEQYAKWSGSARMRMQRDGMLAGGFSEGHSEGASMVRRLTGVLKRSAPDIAIHTIAQVPNEFDARFSALGRRYEYRLRPHNARRDPLTDRFTAEVPRALDLDRMNKVSQRLIGLQDFTTFCKMREGATAVRELLAFEWRETEDQAYAARIEADAFCHSMVRSLVGGVVGVGSGAIEPDGLVDLRDARERTSRFATMPARGLSLEEIRYPSDNELAARAELTRAKRDPISG